MTTYRLMLVHRLASPNTPEFGCGDYANTKTEHTEVTVEAPGLRKAYALARKAYAAELRDAPLPERVSEADPESGSHWAHRRPHKIRFSGAGLTAYLVEVPPPCPGCGWPIDAGSPTLKCRLGYDGCHCGRQLEDN